MKNKNLITEAARLQKLAGIKVVTEDAADDLNKWMDTPLASLGANPVDKLPNDAKALAAKGQEDKNPKDDATISGGSGATDVALRSLQASQNEVGMKQSLANILGAKNATYDGINWGDVNWLVEHMKPGVTITFKSALLGALTKDGAVVLDGHHRWSQAFMLNPDAKVNVVLAKATDKTADETLKAVHLAILAKTGKSETKSASGGNLFTAGEGDVKQYLATAPKVDPATGSPSDTGVAPYVAAVMKVNNISDPAAGEAAAIKRVLEAIKVCAATVVKGAPSRDAMPQADNETNPIDAGAAMTALASGDINYSEPFIAVDSVNKSVENRLLEAVLKRSILELSKTTKRKK